MSERGFVRALLWVEEVKEVSAVRSSLLGIGPENPGVPVTLLNDF